MVNAPVLEEAHLHIEAAAITDRGRQRPRNEDAVFEFTTESQTGSPAGLYVVCDGLGGHEAGEIASQLAVQSVVTYLAPMIADWQTADPKPDALHQQITQAISRANDKVWAYNNQKNLTISRQAGTTLTMALLLEQTAVVANVGDSRTYLWREGQLEQITRDHSLAAQLVENGVIEAEGQEQHPWRNIITRALGRNHEVEVDIFDYILQAGDRLLLCSDGLWQAFTEVDELEAYLDKSDSAEDICRQLIREANHRDGSDNISAVVVCTDETLLS
jgi:protein phosphatase